MTMPVQQINVKNSSEIENFEWTMPPYQQNVRGGARMGSSSSQTSYSNSSGDICRICHCESDSHNPLLAPCYCSGSLKYVHQSCLQQWLTASDTRSCELCKFNFIMHTKIKPFNEWRLLEMSGVERRRLCCAVLFHCVAALCVMWSLFVLIERAVEEVNKGLIAWPFWTKLVVVAVGFTGGAVFMYIQCRQYLSLCSRWRTHNRILLIQNAPEKMHPVTQSPPRVRRDRAVAGQVVANIEDAPRPAPQNVRQFHVEQHPLPQEKPATYTEEDESGGFESYKFNPYRRVSSVNENKLFTFGQSKREKKSTDIPEIRRYSDTRLMQALDTRQSAALKMENFHPSTRTEPVLDPMKMQHPLYTAEVTTGASTSGNYRSDEVYHISNQFDPPVSLTREYETRPQVSDIIFRPELDPLEFNIREMLELDAQSTLRKPSVLSLNHEQVTCQKPGAVFKSLPNLSASSENLLPQKPNS